jgi:hypothetical protein
MTDAKNRFSWDQDGNGWTATDNYSTSALNFKAANIGVGEPLWLVIDVTTTVTSGGAATIAFKLQDSPDDSSYSDTAVVTAAIGKATLVAGYRVLKVALPANINKYARIDYLVGTSALTAGKFRAYIVGA